MAEFLRKHTLPVVACVVALISMLFVPPSAAYLDYFDFRTLSCLFCISASVNALVGTGVFDRLAQRIVRTLKTQRACVAALVGITLVAAMFITNYMALLTFLPLSFLVLNETTRDKKILPWCFVLQNAAAVLGGMILPFGNPHNLYLYNLHSIPTPTFILTMLPTFATAVALIAVGCIIVKPAPLVLPDRLADTGTSFARNAKTWESVDEEAGGLPGRTPTGTVHKVIYFALFALTLGAILHVIPYQAALVIVLATLLVCNRWVLARVDYGLLVTFAAFFVFAGNMSSIPSVESFVVGMLQHNELLTTVLTCQVISNLPTTLLLAPFTGNWPTLLVATDIAGMGTPIASLASLITIKAFMGYRRADTGLFMRMFLAVGFGMLAVLYLVASLTL